MMLLTPFVQRSDLATKAMASYGTLAAEF